MELIKYEDLYFDFDQSVCTTAICYSGPISEVPTKEQLLEEKSTYAKLQIDTQKLKN